MSEPLSDPNEEASGAPVFIEDQRQLTEFLGNDQNEGLVVRTKLKASDRVIARVTDGIYRQPGSALRELISNAWDADANRVDIFTDVPRFSSIRISDDGTGMSYQTLARLLTSIGGSAKRTGEAVQLGFRLKKTRTKRLAAAHLLEKLALAYFPLANWQENLSLSLSAEEPHTD